jgi:hypothetical protein
MRHNSASSGVWAKAAPSPAEKCAEDGAGNEVLNITETQKPRPEMKTSSKSSWNPALNVLFFFL